MILYPYTFTAKVKNDINQFTLFNEQITNVGNDIRNKCKQKNKSDKNESLLKYLRPASKPSKILVEVAANVDDRKFLTNWSTIEHDGWSLPCTKEKYDWCGIWQTLGCLNKNIHEMFGHGRSVFIKHYQRSCYRASCEECYLKWIARGANRATRRLEKYSKRKPIHLMLMVPLSQYNLPYHLLRKRMMEIVQIVRWEGGAVIFHPFKFNKKLREWYYSPHFHLVGFGNRDSISMAFGRYGWYVKPGDERRSVFQTFCYLLSHCGIKKNHHAVTWIGEISYSKVPSEKEPKIKGCPYCWCPLIAVWYDGVHPKVPAEQYFEGLLEYDDHWHPVETWKNQSSKVVVPEYLFNEYLFDYEEQTLCLELSRSTTSKKCYICGKDLVYRIAADCRQHTLVKTKIAQIVLWNNTKEDVCFTCHKIVQDCLLVVNRKLH